MRALGSKAMSLRGWVHGRYRQLRSSKGCGKTRGCWACMTFVEMLRSIAPGLMLGYTRPAMAIY